MTQYQLYNRLDVDNLKEQLEKYKEALHSVKTGELPVDYLMAKEELYQLNGKLVHLEGVMKKMDEQHHQDRTDYEQQAEMVVSQLESVNDSVNHLQRDINLMKAKVDRFRFNDLLNKMDHLIEMQHSTIEENRSEIERLNEQILEMKNEWQAGKEEQRYQEPQYAPPRRRSEYRQLQSMLQSSHIEPAYQEKKSNGMNRQTFRQPPQYNQNHSQSTQYGSNYGGQYGNQHNRPMNNHYNSQHSSQGFNKQMKHTSFTNDRNKATAPFSPKELNKNVIIKSNSNVNDGKKNSSKMAQEGSFESSQQLNDSIETINLPSAAFKQTVKPLETSQITVKQDDIQSDKSVHQVLSSEGKVDDTANAENEQNRRTESKMNNTQQNSDSSQDQEEKPQLSPDEKKENEAQTKGKKPELSSFFNFFR
ncbi:hypothetical protein MUN89_04545 [Halobacillus salinarum]|uniref:Uncharacterized protein n=1 Tax=Halobacillus salinarum TaxID=2932257 RepID=A0ABY4EM64_9BACI|nr:hypothetical protein [Halobacillus salinarum]UOQ45223.1 hypothetical protein MUN89_04545 [Halobacillus salinarum]